MISLRFLAAILWIFAGAIPTGAATKSKTAAPGAGTSADGTYRGAIVMDAATGEILFEDNADTISPPASMVKLMTFAVLHDKLASGALSLTMPVRIVPSDAGIGGSQVYLDPRETFPVEELLYAMMIHSANDAAQALARIAGGTVKAFVDQMNAKARELGLTNSTFRTPHGLPPANRRSAEGDLGSPRDYAILGRYLVQKTNVLKYTSIRLRLFGEGVRAQPTQMVNRDDLIGHVAGADGLKTGTTASAGSCLTATAERQGRRVIVALMGAPSSKVRNLKVIELLDLGFAALPPPPPVVSAIEDNSPVTAAPPPPPQPKAAAATVEEASPSIKFTPPKRKK